MNGLLPAKKITFVGKLFIINRRVLFFANRAIVYVSEEENTVAIVEMTIPYSIPHTDPAISVNVEHGKTNAAKMACKKMKKNTPNAFTVAILDIASIN